MPLVIALVLGFTLLGCSTVGISATQQLHRDGTYDLTVVLSSDAPGVLEAANQLFANVTVPGPVVRGHNNVSYLVHGSLQDSTNASAMRARSD